MVTFIKVDEKGHPIKTNSKNVPYKNLNSV